MRSLLCALLLLTPAVVLAQGDARKRALATNEQGIAKFKAGHTQQALALFKQAIELQPKDTVIKKNAAHCLIVLGDRQLKKRQFAAAARDYHEAAGLTPSDPRPFVREALAWHQSGNSSSAIAVLAPLIKRHPKLLNGHVILAQAYYKLGQNKRSVKHWEAAAALDPKDERIKKNLARAKRDEKIEEKLYLDLGAAHFRIKYDGTADRAIGQTVVRVLEAAYREVGLILGRYPAHEVSVVVYPAKTFRAATGAHAWMAGLYDGKIRVPARGLKKASRAAVRRVLVHEYSHALLRAVGGPKVPVWFHEGFAQVAEGRRRRDARKRLNLKNAPTLKQLSGSFAKTKDVKQVRLLYDAACDLVLFMIQQGGYPALADVLDRLAKKEKLDATLRWIYGQNLSELFNAWKATLPPGK